MSGGSMEPASKAYEVLDTITKEGLQWLSAEHLKVNFCMVAAVLDDPEFPLCVQAALALTEMVLLHDPHASPSLFCILFPSSSSPLLFLPSPTDSMLMYVGDLDILNRSMEVMVGGFQTELLPVAAQLTARLIISTIEAIILIRFTLKTRFLLNLWPIFKLTYNLLKLDAADFLEGTFPTRHSASLTNTYHRDSPVNRQLCLLQVQDCQDANYQHMLLDVYQTSITRDAPLPPFPPGFRPLDGSAQSIQLSVSVHVLGQTSGPDPSHDPLAHRMILGSSSSAPPIGCPPDRRQCFLLTPSAKTATLCLASLEALAGFPPKFFDLWFAAINNHKMPHMHDKRLAIMALCALLEMAPGAVPESLNDGWLGIAGGMLKIFRDLLEAVAAHKALEELEGGNNDHDLVNRKILNMNKDNKDVWDKDSAYLEMLANEKSSCTSVPWTPYTSFGQALMSEDLPMSFKSLQPSMQNVPV
ncbi:hypothetical protein B0H14DRAFT_3574873 [Mycena olivaceomarginata]|nr:hypothetical protein B0H14DRAFT_3574873 [Mycena olivaceomarginata]